MSLLCVCVCACVCSAMHTAFSASDEVFDMAIHLRAPHRLMELMESASTSPARCAHAMQLVLLLLSRPPQPPTTSAPPQSFIDSNAPSVQTSGDPPPQGVLTMDQSNSQCKKRADGNEFYVREWVLGIMVLAC